MCAERLPGEQKNSFADLAASTLSWGACPLSLAEMEHDRAQRGGPPIFCPPPSWAPLVCPNPETFGCDLRRRGAAVGSASTRG
jgi:hypothetical protein